MTVLLVTVEAGSFMTVVHASPSQASIVIQGYAFDPSPAVVLPVT